MLFDAELNRIPSSVFCLFDDSEGGNNVKYGFVLILLDAHHLQNAIQLLQEDTGHPCTDQEPRINRIMRRNRSDILPAEATKLNDIANTSTAIVIKEAKMWI